MSDRPIWTTQKVRANDLQVGDVTRDAYKRWDTVISVNDKGEGYTAVNFAISSGALIIRSVALVDVQVPKPS